MINFELLRRNESSRRAFLATMAAAGLGMAASRLFAIPGNGSKPPVTEADTRVARPSDFTGIPGRNINEQVLNFALTLEILEADIYRQALNYASGLPLRRSLSSNPRAYARNVEAGKGLTSRAANVGFVYLRDFTYVEAAHRDFLIAAIQAGGGTPVTANPAGYKFPALPKARMSDILAAILPLEETGVRAYLGAVRSLVDPGLVQTAGTIYSTEARHSGVLQYILGRDPGPARLGGDRSVVPKPPAENTFEYYQEPQQVITAARAYFN
ncbi:MAG: ferritin-like domain-containing protein [Anaerolineae bacterium]|nr:ferritin-like domain-containing protein [Phycisphaerae bacterium]